MRLLFAATVDLSIVLGLALAATFALRNRSAALRHWVLAAAVGTAAATPALELVVPQWELPFGVWWHATDATTQPDLTLAPTAFPAGPSGSLQRATPPAGGSLVTVDWARVLSLTWMLGTVISLGTLFVGLARLSRLASRSKHLVNGRRAALAGEVARMCGVKRAVLLLESEHPTLLVTWGLARPKIILPTAARAWSDDRMRVVLAHELAHIRRGDWAVQIGAELLRCVYWFNPLVSVACRRLRRESEYACDDAVLSAGVKATVYATHLLEVARLLVSSRHNWSTATAMAHPSTLEGRIGAMLNVHLNRTPVTQTFRLAAALAFVVIAVPVAGFGASPASVRPIAVSTSVGIDIPLAATDVAAVRVDTAQRAKRLTLTPDDAPAAAAAQDGSGGVSGQLSDQTGAVLPGVMVTLSDATSGAMRSATTDGRGLFFILSVPRGTYELEAELPGFATHQETMTLRAGERVHRTFTLQVGSLMETITVTGGGGDSQDTTRRVRMPEVNPSGRGAGGGGAVQPESGRGSASGVVRVGGVIRQPAKVFNVNPVYPAGLAASGIDGRVVLLARIGMNGSVTDVRLSEDVNDPAIHPDLVAAATDAVQQWKFTPTLLNGVPVEVNMTVNVSFSSR